MIIGIGTDLVSLTNMAEQLAVPGSRFLERVLTRREHRVVHHRVAAFGRDQDARVGTGPDGTSDCHCAENDWAVERIGTLWAIKEAVIKAWSAALFGTAPPISEEKFPWTDIEVVHDHWQRPMIELKGLVAHEFGRTLPSTSARPVWHVSASRDHDFAMATVVLSGS